MLQAFTEEAISTLREDINSTEMDQGKFIIFFLTASRKDFCASFTLFFYFQAQLALQSLADVMKPV